MKSLKIMRVRKKNFLNYQLDIEKIWHFACPASPTNYQSDPIKTTMIIFEGTNNMLQLAKEKNAIEGTITAIAIIFL